MNFKERFQEIVEKIEDRENIEGIDKIFNGADSYYTITAKGMGITRGCGGDLYSIFPTHKKSWCLLENSSEEIEKWFDYVESKVKVSIPDKVIVNGKEYELVN